MPLAIPRSPWSRDRSDHLCKTCSTIPFNELLPTSSAQASATSVELPPLIFGIKVKHVLDRKDKCRFCDLLYRSVCRPENDLFKSEHIKAHFHTSEQLKNVQTFREWCDLSHNSLRETLERSDIWPFGHSHDPKECKEVRAEAEALFCATEEDDIQKGATIEKDELPTVDITDTLAGVTAGFGIATIAGTSNTTLARVTASGQMLTAQAAIFTARKAKRLPCWFIIRAYRPDEAKSGALSVRVYAHGRAPRAPLKEISHFSFRFEGAGEPRLAGYQLWYGRTLSDLIDLEFFRTCLNTCHEFHGPTCNEFSWSLPNPTQFTASQERDFRLVDVLDQRIIAIPFQERSMYPYVALSYVWDGNKELAWWHELPNPSPITSSTHPDHELDFYYEHKKTGETVWDHPLAKYGRRVKYGNLTQLCSRNMTSLQKHHALHEHERYLPQTIHDAMSVVQRIGQRYLWVDRLCIVQDAPKTQKTAELSRMAYIYGEALFTIVAADSMHMNVGINGISESNPRAPPDQITSSDIIPDARLFLPIASKQGLRPWNIRAWTFQEKLLSRRLLIFSDGLATWHCRGAEWREDVNALDAGQSSSHLSWTKLHQVEQGQSKLERHGLTYAEEDGSTRLLRRREFEQYTRLVEDFTPRRIGIDAALLDAFQGLEGILRHKTLVDSDFRYGLPLRFIEAALLWYPRAGMQLRRPERGADGSMKQDRAPTWSWACRVGTENELSPSGVYYERPYDFQATTLGLSKRQTSEGFPDLPGPHEERMRPLEHTMYIASETNEKNPNMKLTSIGLFSKPEMLTQNLENWETGKKRASARSLPQSLIPILNDRHLVTQTEVAWLDLGPEILRLRACLDVAGYTFSQEIDEEQCEGLEKEAGPTCCIATSHERVILDPDVSSRSKTVGFAKLDDGRKPRDSQAESFQAIVLSEAQYFGNEKNIDVLGYPLYNIMIVIRRSDQVFERLGLGRIYKSAWRRAKPKQEVVVLE